MIARNGRSTVLTLLALLPLFYIAAPLLHMMGSLTFLQFVNAAENPEIQAALFTSVASALMTTIFSVVFGLPTAYWLSLKKNWVRGLANSILVLPLILPPVVGGIAQLFLYGPETMIGSWLGNIQLNAVNSMFGVILAQTYITSPFLILAAKAGFEEVPAELKEATQILGGGIWRIFFSVSLPLARAAIFSGILLTFARAMGEFGATMIMAYHPYTVPVDIWVQFTSGGFDQILPMAALMIVLAVIVSIIPGIWQRKMQ